MINVSNSYLNAVKGEGRTFKTKLVINNKEYTEFSNFVYRSGVETSNTISFGSVFSSFINTTLIDVSSTDVLVGKAIFYIGVMVDDINETYEYIKLGTLNIESIKKQDDSVVLNAYDNFYLTEKLFTLDNSSNNTVNTILSRVGAICGFEVSLLETDISYPYAQRLNGLTCREVIAYIASFTGNNARFNPDGKLELTWYVDSQTTINADRFSSPLEIGDKDVVLGGVRCTYKIFSTSEGNETTEDAVLEVKNDDLSETINFSSLYMDSTQLDKIFNKINGFTFRSGSIKWILAEPQLTAGDIITVVDVNNHTYKIPIMDMELKCDGGLSGTIESKYKTKEEKTFDFKGPLSKQVANTYAELGAFKKVYADNIAAANGRFNTIETNVLNVSEELNAVKGTIGDLDVGKLEVRVAAIEEAYISKLVADELYADKATLDTVNADVANINKVLAGNIGTGSLQTIHLTGKNVIIDDAIIKSSMIESINTNEVTIGNDQIIISGSTQQFKDSEGNVRVQIGQDAQGNFNFIVADSNGAAIYGTDGITQNAVPDGLIVDKMVSDNANISGKKLNIASVIEKINEDESKTINSNKIWIDEENQSLGAKFDSITETVNHIQVGAVNLIRNAKTMIYDKYEITSLSNESSSKLGMGKLGKMILGKGE